MKALLALLLVSSQAFAAENGSEFMHQAPANTPELTPLLTTLTQTRKFKGGDKAEISGFVTGVLFEYGLSDSLSAGAALAVDAITAKLTPASGTLIDDTQTQAGFEDLKLFFHGRTGRETSFRYGVDFALALGKEKIESDGDTNSFSGGIAAAPFVGMEWIMGRNTFGVKAEYKLWVADRKGEQAGTSSTAGYDYTRYGGGYFSPSFFYEAEVGMTTIGAAFELVYTNDSDKRKDGQSISRATGTTSWNLNVYVPVHVTPTITILPQISYGELAAMDTTTLESLRTTTFQVAGRFAF